MFMFSVKEFVGSVYLSANDNFGPPHTSLKSTELAWSANRKTCAFENTGIGIILRSLVQVEEV
jgi:hypothetical protein